MCSHSNPLYKLWIRGERGPGQPMNFKMIQLTSGLHVAKCCSYNPNVHENWAEHSSTYSPGCIWSYLIFTVNCDFYWYEKLYLIVFYPWLGIAFILFQMAQNFMVIDAGTGEIITIRTAQPPFIQENWQKCGIG